MSEGDLIVYDGDYGPTVVGVEGRHGRVIPVDGDFPPTHVPLAPTGYVQRGYVHAQQNGQRFRQDIAVSRTQAMASNFADEYVHQQMRAIRRLTEAMRQAEVRAFMEITKPPPPAPTPVPLSDLTEGMDFAPANRWMEFV